MAAATISAGTGPAVLLGCAHTGTADHLTAILESWHYHVEAVSNGREAMTRLSSGNPPSIAMLDMDLPAPGGVQIVWEIRRQQEQRRTWVLLLSSVPGKDRVRAALEAGCDDFLLIPPEAVDLKVRIRVAERVLALNNQLHRQSAELRYQATHDGLTGLWNREALLSLIFQETDRVQRMRTPLSLMLLDLDGFSKINHDYGYEAGDRVLTEMANRFRRQLRSYDLIGRCGEDEFLLALPGCTRENAMALVERIRQTILARPFTVENDATTLTASFGVAVSRGRSPLVVLREAERALAEAKLAGRNCVCCDSSASGLGLDSPLGGGAESCEKKAG